MRNSRSTAWLALAVLAAALVVPSGGPVAAADPDPLGGELMRLTNLDRQALGLPALAIDPTLVGFAGATPWSCPTDAALSPLGRSSDMATRLYFSHAIKDCLKADGTEYGALDIMSIGLGYATSRAENIASNSGYSTTATVLYDTGCAIGESANVWPNWAPSSSCPGAGTDAIESAASAERGFMNSSGHRANLLGAYDRFGCGAGTDPTGAVFYACVFSLGGPSEAVETVAPSPDTTRPRVTRETGRYAIYRRGYGHRFYATLSDDRALRSAAVYLDGVRIRRWSWSSAVRSVRASVWVPAWRLRRGTHTLVWRVVDVAGNRSTTSDGKVVFTIR